MTITHPGQRHNPTKERGVDEAVNGSHSEAIKANV